MKPKTRERRRISLNSDDGSSLLEEDEEVDEFSRQDDKFLCDEERSQLLNSDVSNDDYSCLHEKEPLNEDSLPKSIAFIIGNEFCERFSYYGLKTVLALYLTSELLFTEDSATSLYHGWSFSCYFTTIFGAILADSFLGRYRTILYLSIVYLTGNSVLSLAATKPIVSNLVGKTTISVIGLLLIAVGTGGIKPCVAAFGGDQFVLPEQEHQLSKFFSIFYFSINAGSLLSTILTPILREDVTCFGGNCFPLAFGIPAILMLVALVLFMIGTPLYKIKTSNGNELTDVVKCITFAGVRKLSSKFSVSKNREINGPSHWLDLAEGKVPSSLIKDVKILLNVLVLFLPLPFFWALFEQQGSRWTFQATKMSGEIGSWTLKPDQMQVFNPLLILILIPMFEYLVYPWLSRWRILTKPLHRMFVGGLLASFAFVISGFLQFKIEGISPINNGSHLTLGIINALPCDVMVNLTSMKKSRFISPHEVITDTFHSMESLQIAVALENQSANGSTSGNKREENCPTTSKKPFTNNSINTWRKQETILVINSYLGKLEVVDISKPSFISVRKYPRVRLVDTSDFLRLSYVRLRYGNDTIKISSNFFSKGVSTAEVINLKLGRYEVFLPNISLGEQEESLGYFSIDDALSSLVLLIYNLPSKGKVIRELIVMDLKPTTIHMLWLLPQYLFISIGEVMFSITGIQFSFIQAPPSMKSVVQASWLMTVAFGNLIVVIIAETKLIKTQSLEFFFFAGLMFLDMLVFLFLVRRFDRGATLENNADGIKSSEDFYLSE